MTDKAKKRGLRRYTSIMEDSPMISYDDIIMALGATDDEEVKAENRKLCERYPFLKYHTEFGRSGQTNRVSAEPIPFFRTP